MSIEKTNFSEQKMFSDYLFTKLFETIKSFLHTQHENNKKFCKLTQICVYICYLRVYRKAKFPFIYNLHFRNFLNIFHLFC